MSEKIDQSTNPEARNNSVLYQKLTVGVVTGAMAVGALWASQEMSDQYQNDVRDCVEREETGVEECTYPEEGVGVGDDKSGTVELAGYALAVLSAISLLGAKREAE